eukprot:gene13199-9731_t
MFMKKSTVSIALSLLNGDFVSSQQKLYVHGNGMNFISISPKLITNANQMIQMKGNSFQNRSIITTKFFNSKMQEMVQSNLIENDTISIPIPKKFYVENILYPFDLKVSVSFDNGISFVETNQSVKIISLNKIELNPSNSPRNTSISFGLNLPYYLNGILFALKLISNANTIDLNCNSDYSLCNSSKYAFIKSGQYDLYVYTDSLQILLATNYIIYDISTEFIIFPSNLYQTMKNVAYIHGS